MSKLNLKGIDFKGFFIDHGEKVGFVVFLLVTLGALATTTWSRYPKSPEEILLKVTTARNAIQASTWPESKRSQFFPLQDFMERTKEVRGPLSAARYAFSTPMWHPLYRKVELRKEPELLAVLDLDAVAGTFVLGLQPKSSGMGELAAVTSDAESESDGTSSGGSATAKAKPVDNEFAPRTAGAAGGVPLGAAAGFSGLPGATPMGLGAGGAHGAGGAGSGLPESYAPPGADPAMAGAYGEMGLGMSEGYGAGMGAGPSMEARGERFIAVRGIWPLREQLQKFQKALGLQNLNEARAALEITDFVLERQTAVPGSDPWAGPWEQVDISRAQEVLDEAYNYDIDPVDPRLTDVVITMPLPYRMIGTWGDLATHPRIKDFRLAGPERERMAKLEEMLIAEFDKMRLAEESRTRQRGGFSKNSRNLRAMATTIFTNPEAASTFTETMDQTIKTDASLRGLTKEQIRALLTSPADRLLLFRYFDFDVRPGYAYRYRVKLVLRNPNYDLKDLVADPSYAEGEFRETPWSKESNPAVVPESVNYFLKVVDRDPVNELSRPRGNKPVARFQFYEWDASVGTMIADIIDVATFGQFVGEAKKKSLRLNVAKPSFKTEEVTFRSEDLLLDAEGDLRVNVDDHKDLKLPTQNKGLVGLLPAAVVINAGGELVLIDPTTNLSREAELKDRVQREREHYKHLENKEDKPAGSALDLYGGAEMADYNPYGTMPGAGGKGKGTEKTGRKPTSRKPPPMSGGSSSSGAF
jgi:hypothetical protein